MAQRYGRDRGRRQSRTRALVVQADAWIEDFAAAVARDIAPRPNPGFQLIPGDAGGGERPPVGRTRHVIWIAGEKLDAAFLEMEETQADGPGLMPVTQETWITLRRTDGSHLSAHQGI